MANKNPIAGLRPIPDAKGAINTRLIDISASNAMVLGVFSPYTISGGEALAVATYSDGSEKVSGSIVRLLTDSGKSVLSVPASTDGYKAEVTIDANQRFIITMSGTGFADSDAGKFYSLTDETLVASTDGFIGDGFSRRQLDTSTESASAGQFAVSQRSGSIQNAASTDDVEVICTIHASNFVQA
jgi:hypothetical protein